ncbi:serine hydrolase [Catenuloplanes indicus JCM 9534]
MIVPATVLAVLAAGAGIARVVTLSDGAQAAVPIWHAPATAPPRILEKGGVPPLSPRVLETGPVFPVRPAAVRVAGDAWWSWALLDHRTGTLSGSPNLGETSGTASLIKAWIGADFLRRADEAGRRPGDRRMRQLRIMLRDSDNEAAEVLWAAVGQSESIRRLRQVCQLIDGGPYRQMWSNTRLSARDVVLLGRCIADGRAAGPTWTPWLLREMRAVRGVGDFGIRKAFPEAVRSGIAIKNGWVVREALGEWHVNCLAIGDGWSIGVLTRYPAARGYAYGAAICRKIGRQLRA